jgi:pimeloyl-ACP methyl ester carboxylesterase
MLAPTGSMRAMPQLEREGLSLYYEEHGDGFPLLLFAPGGMRSSVEVWERAPWHPIRELASEFRVIAMDQRNAGRSRATVRPGDGWHSYAADHVALLDHLGIERCLALGGCIGSSFALGLIASLPGRVAAAVLQNPIGLHDNRDLFYALFDGWAAELASSQPGMDAAAWGAFRERMYGGDFVFNVSRDFVRSCRTPLLVLAGSDPYHPAPISRELAAVAPNAELIEGWKEPEALPGTVARVRQFLRDHAGRVAVDVLDPGSSSSD